MTELKIYSLQEVKKHTDTTSTWFVIDNYVYDVTEFLNEHPGGEEVLLEQAGGDATEAFEDVGHSNDARDLMKKYRIGQLTESDRINVENAPSAYENSAKSQTIASETPPGSNRPPKFIEKLITYLLPFLLIAGVGLATRYYIDKHYNYSP